MLFFTWNRKGEMKLYLLWSLWKIWNWIICTKCSRSDSDCIRPFVTIHFSTLLSAIAKVFSLVYFQLVDFWFRAVIRPVPLIYINQWAERKLWKCQAKIFIWTRRTFKVYKLTTLIRLMRQNCFEIYLFSWAVSFIS